MSNIPQPKELPKFGAHEPYPLSQPSGDDLLPPVEPPSARFIIQLFVVPALIVMLVVGVWLVVTWLVRSADPEALIRGLESSSVARWQKASELADLLRNERFAEFRSNANSARQLAAILDREIDAADTSRGMEEEAVTLRYFLSRALGEFHVDEGTDVLLKAAMTSRDPREQIVRRGALQALAIRAFNLSQRNPPAMLADSQVETALAQLANDEDELVRSETAFALGQLGTRTALVRLEEMVDDPHADTRYNAAVALAQHGHVVAIPTLAEMIDPQEMASVREEPSVPAQFFKRSLIVTNALDAIENLAKQNPNADFSPAIAVLEAILSADSVALEQARFHPTIVPRAKETLKILRTPREPAVTG